MLPGGRRQKRRATFLEKKKQTREGDNQEVQY